MVSISRSVAQDLSGHRDADGRGLGEAAGFAIQHAVDGFQQGGVEFFAALVRLGVQVAVLTNSLEATDVAPVHAGYAKRRVPLRRYGEPEEVAHMTLNLCLPASSFVNGASIPVDGGMTVRHT